ncbi:MAG: membrane protein [Actinomycetota bacterium]|nr:MAG: membrane protein [Actinomycetota bacterium]
MARLLRAAVRHPLRTAGLLVAVGVVAVLPATGWAVWRAAHRDEASVVERVDAILVLGAAQYQGVPSPVFAGRLEHAALLYRQGRAGVVLVLGAGRPGDVSTEAEAGRAFLLERSLPPEAVVAVPEGTTTLESLRAAAAWMREHGLSSAFLVSDPWHNLRIRRMARDLGLEAYVSATWRSAARSQRTRLEGYVRETLAYLYYRLFGR